MIDQNITIDTLNSFNKNTLMETLGIEFTEIGGNFIKAKMPVGSHNHQPAGLLHGGATAALIETLGSCGSMTLIDIKTQSIVGIDLNVNHIRAARSGWVEGIAKIEHTGRKLHVWCVDVFNDEGKKISIGRISNLVIEK